MEDRLENDASQSPRNDGQTFLLMEDRLWTVQEVADYLGVSIHTVYCWRSTDSGPPGRRIGRRLRYRPQDVRAWVAGLPTRVL